MKPKASLLLLNAVILSSAAFLYPQTPASRLVSRPINETRLVKLHGNVHPLAQARYDRGAVPDAFPAGRVILMLNRPPEREAALRQFMTDLHRRGSASYHQWLTPQEYGQQFGPANADIQAAEDWLSSHGFIVAKVTNSRQFIEFSGTAGQLRSAFHTEIHQYEVNGETHYANAKEISIPAALAPLVRGVSPLNNFRSKPYIKVSGPALYSRSAKKTTPLFTIPNPFGTGNPSAFLLAPEDFATQYDLAPLYQAGVNGSGQTIGIINESNIDLSLVSAYQQLFGLSNNPPQVVIDGDDPGTLSGVDTEAYLDVEVSGAVAPNATVNLYIAGGSDIQDPIILASIRAVEDDQASVLSVSFGACEDGLGNAGNQFWSELWEQAAAQGQTVLVSSGDNGSECEAFAEPSVSGIASTPWNVAVGGTDFFYSDYASGGASAATLWNQTNDSNLGSLKAPLPEQVWNDPFGLDVIDNGVQRNELFAGGGGASNCNTISPSTGTCAGGYAKPSWQTGAGVPADGVRDLPDVSLFASNGANLSAYPICAFPGECGTGAGTELLLVGGTSASSPAMAGIMALINQKFGRQGQANFTLYPLAQQKPAAFHDITLGSNQVLCFSGTLDCNVEVTTVYLAGPGYDLASGLGSVDANVLVNDWNSITFLPTNTKLSLSSTKITHGTPITVSTSVAPASGTGTPSGGVAILTTSTLPASQGQTVLTLSGGSASSAIDFFPGGFYNVTANYKGDAVFGGSTSAPVALTVTPENSNINFVVLNEATAIPNGGSILYDQPLSFAIQPVGASAPSGMTNGNATGTGTFTVDSLTATTALNGTGVAAWMPPALAVGNHTASATYSGDSSFNASSASPVAFTVLKGAPDMNDNIQAPLSDTFGRTANVNAGGSLTVTIQVGPFFGPLGVPGGPSGVIGPTGTVTTCLNSATPCVFKQTAPLVPASGPNSQYSTATVTFTNLTAGFYAPHYVYNGDANWQVETLDDVITIDVASPPALPATTTALSVTPASISGTQLATFTATVTGSSGVAPTGSVFFYNNGVFLAFAILTPTADPSTSALSFVLSPPSFFSNGNVQILAIYNGDSNYLPSFSNMATLAVTNSGSEDFSLAPQLPQVNVKAGSSGTVGLNLGSLNNFNGVVTLTCTPSSSQITCSIPSSLSVSGAATATLTINAAATAARLPSQHPPGSRLGWMVVASVVLTGFAGRKRRRILVLSLGLIAALLIAVGCGGGSQVNMPQQSQGPPPNSATYSVLVTATANGIVHNSKVIVVVN